MSQPIIQDEALLADFVAESREQLANIDDQLIALESAPSAEFVDRVNTVFRTVHSIKGAAGFFGLSNINQLTHAAEEVLNLMRNGQLAPTRDTTNACLAAVDAVGLMLNDLAHEEEADIAAYVLTLQQLVAAATQQPVQEGKPATPTATESEAKPLTPTVLELAAANGINPETLRDFLLEAYENLGQVERDIDQLEAEPRDDAAIRSLFRGIHSLKGAAGFLGFQKIEQIAHAAESMLSRVRSGDLAFTAEIGRALSKAVDALRSQVTAIEATGSETLEHADAAIAAILDASGPATIRAKQSEPVKATLERDAGHDPIVEAGSAISAGSNAIASSNPSSVSESTIRVDVALLDRLMNCVGELVLARNQILQLSLAAGEATFHNVAQGLNRITSELQEGVMKTRMQPIGNAWSKFPRVVRELAQQCNKQVRLEMEGRETELDKTIIEAIRDPLTHLVRNSVDHGIESPEKRRAAGKPAAGCLRLRAYHEGGQVIIEVTDDGQGLNYARIRQKALEKDLISREQFSRLSDHDAAQLILLPGFSTAEKVTHVSGRGVGMDVVKTNIEKIGGTIDIQSQPNAGTCISIKIPLTLAIVPALIVSADNDRFAIPQTGLVELVRLEGEKAKLEYVYDAPVLRLREQLLPIVSLRQIMGLPEPIAPSGDEQPTINIVVLKADDRQFGLIVDAVNDTAEIVVKPLHKRLKGLSIYAGATVMGDGNVALILDVTGLGRHANVLSSSGRDVTHADESESKSVSAETATLLVCTLGQGGRAAFPISSVSRLEEIQRSAIEQAEGRDVVQYRGKFLTLGRIADLLGLPASYPSSDSTEPLPVIVCKHRDGYVGLIVDRIIDVLETPLTLIREGKRPGVKGSAVLQGVVTDILDIPLLVRQVAEASELCGTL